MNPQLKTWRYTAHNFGCIKPRFIPAYWECTVCGNHHYSEQDAKDCTHHVKVTL